MKSNVRSYTYNIITWYLQMAIQVCYSAAGVQFSLAYNHFAKKTSLPLYVAKYEGITGLEKDCFVMNGI